MALSLNEYQVRAMETCTPECNNFAYMFINLVGEIGEFASKVAKSIRKGKTLIQDNELVTSMNEEEVKDLRKEAGDCLWQLAGLCTVMGWSLESVGQENLDKLKDRQKRNVIVGDGDNR